MYKYADKLEIIHLKLKITSSVKKIRKIKGHFAAWQGKDLYWKNNVKTWTGWQSRLYCTSPLSYRLLVFKISKYPIPNKQELMKLKKSSKH